VCRRIPRSSKCCNATAATCSSITQKRAACGVVTVRSGISSKSAWIRQRASSVMLRLTPPPRPIASDSRGLGIAELEVLERHGGDAEPFSIPSGEDHPEPSLVAHHPVVGLLRLLERKRFRHGTHSVHRRE